METDLRIGRLLSMIHRLAHSALRDRIEPLGLGRGGIHFLKQLARQDGMSQDELAKAVLVDKATAARAIARLERDGFISRKADTEDRRVKRVWLAARGRKTLPQIDAVLAEWNELLASDFTKTETKQLSGLLERMVETVRQEVHGEPTR